MEDKIIKILEETGISFKERGRTIHTECPKCHKDDKFSILKANGSTVCYRGSCDWGIQPFTNWVAETLGISVAEARGKVYQTDYFKEFTFEVKKKTNEDTWNPFAEEIPEIPLPNHSYTIGGSKNDGTVYLERRGLPAVICDHFGIKYLLDLRRVMFPVVLNGKFVGYQGRSIDKVPDKDKVRNNEGFRRDSLVMFLDHVKENEFVIIAEGPVDALKFYNVGNFVATMGKIISKKQIDLIKTKKPQKVYLALDGDAALEMSNLAREFDVPTFLLTVPDSCKKRCELINKKADFGECTFEEAAEALNSAQPLGYYNLIFNWEKK